MAWIWFACPSKRVLSRGFLHGAPSAPEQPSQAGCGITRPAIRAGRSATLTVKRCSGGMRPLCSPTKPRRRGAATCRLSKSCWAPIKSLFQRQR